MSDNCPLCGMDLVPYGFTRGDEPRGPSELASATLLADVLRYRRGLGRYNLSRLPESERGIAAMEAWEALETQIENTLSKSGVKVS